MDMITNSDGDTGRFKILADWEHDDPEQAPTYRQPHAVIPDAQTAKEIELSAILRMTAEQIDDLTREFLKSEAA
jgi:hypothetical protein